jgi:hypothetical protein
MFFAGNVQVRRSSNRGHTPERVRDVSCNNALSTTIEVEHANWR